MEWSIPDTDVWNPERLQQEGQMKYACFLIRGDVMWNHLFMNEVYYNCSIL